MGIILLYTSGDLVGCFFLTIFSAEHLKMQHKWQVFAFYFQYIKYIYMAKYIVCRYDSS